MGIGGKASRAKQAAGIRFEYGVDELSAAMTWKKRWEAYNEEVARVKKESKKKGSIVSFVSTALFATAAFFTAGMSTVAQAGISFASGMGGSMLADEMYGDIEGVEPPKPVMRKFHQSRQIEKQAELEGAYTQLNADLAAVEDSFNQMHWQNPLKLTMMFFGKDLFTELTSGSLFGADTSSITVDPAEMGAMSGPGGVESFLNYESGIGTSGEIIGTGQDIGSIIDPISGLDVTAELATINDPLFQTMMEANSDVASFSMDNIFTGNFQPGITEGAFQWDAGYNLILQEIIGGDDDELNLS
jgi:hypothetical protein